MKFMAFTLISAAAAQQQQRHSIIIDGNNPQPIINLSNLIVNDSCVLLEFCPQSFPVWLNSLQLPTENWLPAFSTQPAVLIDNRRCFRNSTYHACSYHEDDGTNFNDLLLKVHRSHPSPFPFCTNPYTGLWDNMHCTLSADNTTTTTDFRFSAKLMGATAVPFRKSAQGRLEIWVDPKDPSTGRCTFLQKGEFTTCPPALPSFQPFLVIDIRLFKLLSTNDSVAVYQPQNYSVDIMRVLDMELIKLFGFTPATAALLGMESTAGGSFRLVYAISHPVELGMAEILGNIHRVGDGDEKGTGRLHVDTYWMANQPQWINGDRLALEPPQEPGWPSEPVSRVMLVFGIVVFLLGMSLLAVLAVRYWQKNKQNPSAYRPIDGQIIF